ncbi:MULTISPECIES: hypothetical protein [Paracoccaceae]|jgi:hypothetical protein|uniref:hypothetical protein n=1 Tax=Rhodobacterales TaxID=204455 RepID=UPI001B1FB3FE|nr:hypothetical protein [Boseongicola sp. H5]MBO6602995.1 hypothetical protein [Roseicyclus sp.]MBO6624262.1 hypothetical protein [Roseicyclus sp.]MBO6921387.1 hypothetical protein [Roseicyclus sp.]
MVRSELENASGTEVALRNTPEVDRDMRLWLKAGYFAMLFCLWSSFIIPIVFVIQMRW